MSERISREANASGGHDFRFRRRGYTLAVGVDRMIGNWYLSASLWMKDSEPGVAAHSREALALWYLSAACPDHELGPRLVVSGPFGSGVSFSLRPAEYQELLEHVVPLGLDHHVPTPSIKGDVVP